MVNAIGVYTSSTDFRISAYPPNLDAPNSQSIEELYAFAQAVIQTFIGSCGTDSQQQLLWPQLAGSPGTLLAGNLNRLYVQASENILGYNAINLHNVGGSLRMRNANATNNTKPCNGFLNYADGVLSGNIGEVIINQGVTQFSGLTPGTRYYLAASNGLVTSTAPVAAGNIEQYVGIAIDATHLAFNLSYWIQH